MAAAKVGAFLMKPHPDPDQKRRKRSYVLQSQLQHAWYVAEERGNVAGWRGG